MTDPKILAALNKAIGARLARVMKAREMPRADLAHAMGTTEARLARILKGSSEMTAPELVLAARALCVSPNHLAA